MLDVFRSDAFSLQQLTAAINKVPFQPGRLAALGLFTAEPVASTRISIEEKSGVLALIQSSRRGAPAEQQAGEKRNLRSFTLLHLTREAVITADEVQGVRAFGSETQTETVQLVINRRLTSCRAAHEATLEHLRVGALQGKILDADGTELFDLFDEFDVIQQTGTVSPDATTDNGDSLRKQIVAIQRLIEVEMGGTPLTTFRAVCGKDFFDDLRSDLGVTQTMRYADPQALLQQQAGTRVFTFAGVTWEEYRGSYSGTPFVADDEAYVYPENVPDLFVTYFGPADFVETVNTLGIPFYAKQAVDAEFQRFVKLHTQSNPLPLCTRPRAVVKVTLTT